MSGAKGTDRRGYDGAVTMRLLVLLILLAGCLAACGGSSRSQLAGHWMTQPAGQNAPVSRRTDLWLRDNGRFLVTAELLTMRGRWTVARPGVLRLDGRSQGGWNLPITFRYTVSQERLILTEATHHWRVVWHREGRS